MRIVVLAGGLSAERDVSLSTGTMVCNALRSAGQDAVLIDLFYGVEILNGIFINHFHAFFHLMASLSNKTGDLIH